MVDVDVSEMLSVGKCVCVMMVMIVENLMGDDDVCGDVCDVCDVM